MFGFIFNINIYLNNIIDRNNRVMCELKRI